MHRVNQDDGGRKMMTQFFPSPSSPTLSGSSVADFTAPLSYSSIFFNSSTSGHSSTSTATTPAASTGASSDLSQLMLRHRDLLIRQQTCLLQLQKTFKEAETLRQENTNLRIANGELNNRLNRLIDAYVENQYSSMMMYPPNPKSSLPPEYVNCPLSSITENFGGLCVREKIRESPSRWESCESPTSVMETDRSERNVDRVSLPKSISVRSTGFLKAATASTSAVPSHAPTRIRPAIPAEAPQKVHVRGGDKKNGPVELELEVYNQGVSKTELCNKWQETESCPYGDHCQFAHGFGELRPVLRHPRYKTEVCRMVLAGDPCPYGHRCHFRHALTEEEKLMVPLKLD